MTAKGKEKRGFFYSLSKKSKKKDRSQRADLATDTTAAKSSSAPTTSPTSTSNDSVALAKFLGASALVGDGNNQRAGGREAHEALPPNDWPLSSRTPSPAETMIICTGRVPRVEPTRDSKQRHDKEGTDRREDYARCVLPPHLALPHHHQTITLSRRSSVDSSSDSSANSSGTVRALGVSNFPSKTPSLLQRRRPGMSLRVYFSAYDSSTIVHSLSGDDSPHPRSPASSLGSFNSERPYSPPPEPKRPMRDEVYMPPSSADDGPDTKASHLVPGGEDPSFSAHPCALGSGLGAGRGRTAEGSFPMQPPLCGAKPAQGSTHHSLEPTSKVADGYNGNNEGAASLLGIGQKKTRKQRLPYPIYTVVNPPHNIPSAGWRKEDYDDNFLAMLQNFVENVQISGDIEKEPPDDLCLAECDMILEDAREQRRMAVMIARIEKEMAQRTENEAQGQAEHGSRATDETSDATVDPHTSRKVKKSRRTNRLAPARVLSTENSASSLARLLRRDSKGSAIDEPSSPGKPSRSRSKKDPMPNPGKPKTEWQGRGPMAIAIGHPSQNRITREESFTSLSGQPSASLRNSPVKLTRQETDESFASTKRTFSLTSLRNTTTNNTSVSENSTQRSSRERSKCGIEDSGQPNTNDSYRGHVKHDSGESFPPNNCFEVNVSPNPEADSDSDRSFFCIGVPEFPPGYHDPLPNGAINHPPNFYPGAHRLNVFYPPNGTLVEFDKRTIFHKARNDDPADYRCPLRTQRLIERWRRTGFYYDYLVEQEQSCLYTIDGTKVWDGDPTYGPDRPIEWWGDVEDINFGLEGEAWYKEGEPQKKKRWDGMVNVGIDGWRKKEDNTGWWVDGRWKGKREDAKARDWKEAGREGKEEEYYVNWRRRRVEEWREERGLGNLQTHGENGDCEKRPEEHRKQIEN